jgi:hypothetical protein
MEILKFIQKLGSSQDLSLSGVFHFMVCCSKVTAVSKLLIPLIKLLKATLLLYRCVNVVAFSEACAYRRFGATYYRHGVRFYSLALLMFADPCIIA